MKSDWTHVIERLEKRRMFLPWNWFIRLPNGTYVRTSSFLKTMQSLILLDRERDENSLMILELLASPVKGDTCFGNHLNSICEKVLPKLQRLGLITFSGQFWFQTLLHPSAKATIAAVVFSPLDPSYWTLLEPWPSLAK